MASSTKGRASRGPFADHFLHFFHFVAEFSEKSVLIVSYRSNYFARGGTQPTCACKRMLNATLVFGRRTKPAKHGGSFKIASKFEELPADDAISEIPEEMLTEVYTRIKLEEKLEGFRSRKD